MFCCLTESVVSSHKLICHFLSKKIKNLRRRVRLPGPYGNFIGSLFMHINNHIWTGIRETGCESLESDIIWYIPSSFFVEKKKHHGSHETLKVCVLRFIAVGRAKSSGNSENWSTCNFDWLFVWHVELCTRWPACCIPWGPCLVLYISVFFFFFFFYGHCVYFCTINSFGNV